MSIKDFQSVFCERCARDTTHFHFQCRECGHISQAPNVPDLTLRQMVTASIAQSAWKRRMGQRGKDLPDRFGPRPQRTPICSRHVALKPK